MAGLTRPSEVKRQKRLVDRWEVQIEQECVRVLALHQPVASDLRRVAAVLKINGDLHRLCDLARHIAKRVKKLAADPQATPIPQALEDLGVEALDQVHESLDALTRSNVTLARSVIDADQRIDRDYRAIQKQLKQEIVRLPAADQYPAAAGQHRAEPRADRRPRREDRRVGHLPGAGRHPPAPPGRRRGRGRGPGGAEAASLKAGARARGMGARVFRAGSSLSEAGVGGSPSRVIASLGQREGEAPSEPPGLRPLAIGFQRVR